MSDYPLIFNKKEDLLSWCRNHLSIQEKRAIQRFQSRRQTFSAIPVYVFDTNGKPIGTFPSRRAASKNLGVSPGRIKTAIQNGTKLLGMFYCSNDEKFKLED